MSLELSSAEDGNHRQGVAVGLEAEVTNRSRHPTSFDASNLAHCM